MAKKRRDPYSYDELLKDKNNALRQWDEAKSSNPLNKMQIAEAIQTLNIVDYRILKSPFRQLLVHNFNL